MADTTATKNVLSVIATNSNRLKELTIVDGQLIFIQDITRIAFDFKGQRKFYNQITEIDTDYERLALDSPISSGYYFVIDTAVLWYYKDGWTQITSKPEEVIFIGTENEIPTLGQADKLYVNTTSGKENISVWDEDSESYVVVADKVQSMTSEDVVALFNKQGEI